MSSDGGCDASATCTAAVVMVDESYFCETQWDPVCVAFANYFCQNDSLNDPHQCCDCLDVRDEPGCKFNAACQVQVCQWDDYCCYYEWDEFCVKGANTLCGNTGTYVVSVALCQVWFLRQCHDVLCLENVSSFTSY